MNYLSNTVRRLALALALTLTAMAAHAGVIPAYKVSINTGGASGAAYLDFSFTGPAGAPAALAAISNLQGAPFAVDPAFEAGTVTDLGPNAFSMVNDYSYRSLLTDLGGLFTFDLAFSGDFLAVDFPDVSTFAVTVYNAAGDMLGGGTAITFSLYSPFNGEGPFVEVAAGNLAGVTLVPEPSQLLLFMTGLALAGAVARRRAGR